MSEGDDSAAAGRLSPGLGRFLLESPAVHYLEGDPDGTVRTVNRAVARRLGVPAGQLTGRPLAGLLSEDDSATFPARLAAGGGELLLNFAGPGGVYTLACRLDVGDDGFVLVGVIPAETHDALEGELLHLNNELAVLARERARRARELEEALAEIERSHWLLEKVGEVLPICLSCGKVRTGGDWQEVAEFLRRHGRFLSHGYCPACAAEAEAEFDRSTP